ncbi:hypothetical protein LAZ67_13002335, partial [Cordylochernes scorpioides]
MLELSVPTAVRLGHPLHSRGGPDLCHTGTLPPPGPEQMDHGGSCFQVYVCDLKPTQVCVCYMFQPRSEVQVEEEQVTWLVQQILEHIVHSNPVVRQSAAVWLLALLKRCGNLAPVRKELEAIQQGFLNLLADSNELTQDMASKGLGALYELSEESQREQLVTFLVEALTSGRKAKTTSIKLVKILCITSCLICNYVHTQGLPDHLQGAVCPGHGPQPARPGVQVPPPLQPPFYLELPQVGKLQPADRVATSSSAGIQDCRNLRLFVTDKNTGLRFLVDSGADISIIPPKDKNRMPSSDYKLYAANGTEIVTYGTKVRNLDIGLRRQFQWPFVIANTNRAIIGADFLNNFGLIIDIKNKRLIDGITNLSIRGVIQSISDMGNISTLNSSSKVSAILTKYPNLCRPPSDFVEAKHSVKHYIPTRGQPIHSKARRLDSQRLTLAQAEFQYMLNNGIIRPSNSPWASPLHLVSKKDESLRPCGDYRRLNAVTLPDRYPIPRLDDFHHILKDDILVASKTEEEHYSHLETLFSRLNSYGLRINLSKSKFLVQEIDFLGYLITSHGVKPLPTKVKAILEYKKPKTVHELRIFLGMLNFYRTFLNNAAETQAILHEYLRGAKKKDRSEIKWSEEAEVQFEKCKQALANTALLAYPDTELPISLCTDASDRAVGSVLQQLDNNNWKPIAFFSKKLNPAQCNYSTYDRELLAIYLSIKFFKHLLEAREFTILTDHKPLIYAFKQKNEKASPRQLRHLQYISQFSTDIKYIKGTDNIVADALSRVDAITTIDYEEIAKEQTVSSIVNNGGEVNFKGDKVTILKDGKKVLEGDQLENGLYAVNIEQHFSKQNDSNLTLPSENKTQEWHRKLGHIGMQNLRKLESLVDGMELNKLEKQENDVCEICIMAKQTRKSFGNERSRATRPLEIVHTDLCGPIEPLTHDNKKYIMTFLDDYTHFCYVYLLSNKYEAKEYIKEYVNEVERFLNAKVSKLRCDNGGEYANTQVKEWCKMKGIILDFTIPYTPQLNGKAERLNRTLIKKTRALLLDSKLNKEMWGEATRVAAYLINRSPSNTVQTTPAQMWFGRKPNLSNVKLFGSEVYVKKLGNLKKLDSKSEKYSLIRYSGNGYRLWDMQKRMIIIARDVVFTGKLTNEMTSVIQPRYREDLDSEIEESQDTKMELDTHDKPQNSTNSKYMLRNRENINRPERLKDYEVLNSVSEEIGLLTYDEAVTGVDKENWIKAIQEEKDSLKKNETWDFVKAECVKELIYIKALIEELTNETILAKLNIDNQSAMTLMKTGQMNRKTKHIDVRYHFLKDQIRENVAVQFCPTKDQVADILTKPLPKETFEKHRSSLLQMNFHELSHPGIKATTKQLTSRFIWPNMNKDIRKWARACVNCQKCKVSIHTKSEIGKYQEVDERFSVVHIDLIGALPPSNGNIYCLTCIDRYTSWMEVVPLPDMKSETVARAFYENWIVRFGAPHTVISDRGKQFTSQLFKDLTTLCGIKLRHSTAYHPQCNGKIERLHRTIKTAIRAHNSIKWTETLPTVLLGLRAAINKDNNHSLSQMVYGKTIRLPGEFFDASKHHLHAEEFVQQLQKQMELLKPLNEKHHSKTKVFVHKDLKTCSHVFIRTDRVKKPLEPPYEGPFPVLERTDKYFTLKVKGKNVTTSIDRLRPAYLLADSDNLTAEHPTATRPIVSGALPSTSSQQNPDPPDVEKYTEFQGTGSAPDLPRTRSGRIIKKP